MATTHGTLTVLVGAPPDAAIEAFGGKWTTGGVAVFTSSRDAVQCALGIAGDGVGIHAGEATMHGERIAGRPVAVASRLAAAARAGEVLVSAVVRELADDGELAFGPAREIEPGLIAYRVEPPARPLRLMLADDHEIVRDGLAALLAAAGQVVAGTAADGNELLAQVARDRPDVAVIDIRMPPTYTDEGLVAAERIRSLFPDVGVLVLSQHAEPTLALRLMSAAPGGGVGYLLKERVSNLGLLLDALQRVHAGETVIDPALGERVARLGNVQDLTPRELEVLALIAEGRSNRAIARQLFVASKTLERHISQIFLKLDLHDATDEHRRVAAVLTYLGHRP
jgi:DNA-binding NarL/FixJ family response regulator